MRFLTKRFAALMLVVSTWLVSSVAWAAPAFQLGFALDGSGSVSTTNYNLLRSGLSAALAAIPANDTIEITVVTYGTNVTTVVAPTLLNASTLPTIQTAINTHTKAGGGTDTAAAIRALTALMTGSSVFADPNVKSIINLATDGAPNSQVAAQAAALEAAAAAIDALSIEAIGSGVSSASALANMAAIAFPDTVTVLPVNSTTIPNPLDGSFVVPVSDFTALDEVLLAKVIASVTPEPNPTPEPGALSLLAIGLLGAAWVRRRKSSDR